MVVSDSPITKATVPPSRAVRKSTLAASISCSIRASTSRRSSSSRATLLSSRVSTRAKSRFIAFWVCSSRRSRKSTLPCSEAFGSWVTRLLPLTLIPRVMVPESRMTLLRRGRPSLRLHRFSVALHRVRVQRERRSAPGTRSGAAIRRMPRSSKAAPLTKSGTDMPESCPRPWSPPKSASR